MHGLSTAYHLAVVAPRARRSGSGADVVVLDKSHPGAGATGIACGVVRNNYFQPAMSELMQACVEVWESDPAAYHYNPVGYIALGPKAQEADLISVHERHERIGYRSELIVGEAEVDAHMKAMFPDWRAQGVTSASTSTRAASPSTSSPSRGSSASARPRVSGSSTRRRGDRLRARRRRRGRRRSRRAAAASRSASRSSSLPARGRSGSGRCSGCPTTIDIRTPSGDVVRDQPMWTLLEPPGGRDPGRPALATRPPTAARPPVDPPRHRRTALHRRRAARHRRALGQLLQARPPRRPGRRRAAHGRRRRRARPVPVDDERRPRRSRTCGAPRSPMR